MREGDDLQGGLGELIRFGTIATVDLAAARCTVACGEIETAAVRWLEPRAGATRSWSPPSAGEQVVLFCPAGDIAGAFALRGLVSDAFPPAGNSRRELTRFVDGAILAYDPDAHMLEAVLPAGGVARVHAPGGLLINAAAGIVITGDVSIEGTLTTTDDVVAGQVSLQQHRHLGVSAGSAQSGPPA